MATRALGADIDADPRVRLTCWGDFALLDSSTGANLKPRGRKARALLAYLALHGGKAVSRERLTGLLWGDRAEEQARASLRQVILELKPLVNGEIGALKVERDHLSLDPDAIGTDLDVLTNALERRDYSALLAALPDPDERLFANLDDIDDGFDDWARIERTRQRDRLAALLADAAAAAGKDGETVAARMLAARHREFDPAAPAPPLSPGAPFVPIEREVERRPAPIGASAHPLNRWRIAALVTLFLLAGLAAIVAWRWPGPPAAATPTIAVLPFKSLSGQDAAFAEGLSDEIMAQLAREPGLRIAGRISAAQFKDRAPDLGEVGRKLGVRYVLEGSVRSAGGRVRVNVALAQASDGLQLWAESFDGTLEDVLAIQNRIGANVAGALGRSLTRGAALAGPTTTGEVYSLYLAARPLIRERNPRALTAAREKLERALALDPNFAPAVSSMAQIKRYDGNAPGAAGQRLRDEALAYARRALELAPDLAEPHAVLGMILGFEDAAGQRHIARAAALDPNNSEYQYWLGNARGSQFDFAGRLAAHRRAFELEPLWDHAGYSAVTGAWSMGHRDEARAYVRRVQREGSRHQAHMLAGYLANSAGDFSRGALEFQAARAAVTDIGRKAPPTYVLASLLLNFGFVEEGNRKLAECRSLLAMDGKTRVWTARHGSHLALKQGDLPTFAEFGAASRLRGDPANNVFVAEAAKRLILAGRAKEIIALYDGAGLLGFSARRPIPASISTALADAPVIAVSLAAVGRRAEADRLLRAVDRIVADALARSRGQALAHVHAQAAQIWALLGRRDAALAALDHARRNNWVNANMVAGDLIDDIGDEPGFAGLRGDPRFESIRARVNRDLARERREMATALAL